MLDTDLSRLRLGDIVDRQAERFGERACIAHRSRNVRMSYREFRERVDTVARGLMALGVRKGEHVALWAPNLPEWTVVQFATAKIGATLVPLKTSYRARELEYVLRHSETTTLFVAPVAGGPDPAGILREILPALDDAPVGHAHFEQLPRFSRMISIGKQRLPGMLRFDDLFDLAIQTHPDDYRRRGEALDSYDVIMLQYTSGTTGFPKGVMLTHRSMIVTAWYMAQGLGLGDAERLCAPIPLSEVFASVGGSIGSVLRGVCFVPLETFDARAVLETIQAEGCTIIQTTPSMLAAILAQPDLESFDRSTLKKGVTGGAPVPIDLARDAVERLGISQLTIGYGLTEASGGVTRSSPDDPPEKRLGTVGRVLASMHAKLVDPRTGEDAAPGAPGELCCRGLGVMKGYFKDPEGTAEAIDAEGWLHTKDLAIVDGDRYVNIVGRLRELIVHNDEKIYPREIEAFLYSHPKIADVHVIGVPHLGIGEDVCAVVKAAPGETIDDAEVAAFCSGRLAESKIPTLVMVVKDYPMTAGGKVLRNELRRLAIEKFGRQADAAATTA